jgi:dihydrofolate reductase
VGRLNLQMQMTVDGMNPDGPNAELSLDEVRDYSLELLRGAETIILGRRTAVDFIPSWDRTAEQPANSWHEVGKLISDVKKVVFSQADDLPGWKNTMVERGCLAEAVGRLKRDTKGGIIVYGGVSFVAALVSLNLIDEFHLFVNPVVQGSSHSIFSALDGPRRLDLQKAKALKGGIVLLHYVSAAGRESAL